MKRALFVVVVLFVFSLSKASDVYSACVSKEVFSINAGLVARIEPMNANDHGMGNNVIIEHTLSDGSKVYSLYAHLAEIDDSLPSEGQPIDRGALIGKMGASGKGQSCYWVNNGGGIHLHFEVKAKAVTGNPVPGVSYCTTQNSCWGYTPTNPEDYGYYDPNNYIGKLVAINPTTNSKRLFWHPTRGPQNSPNCLFDKACYYYPATNKHHAGIDYKRSTPESFNEQF